MWQASSPFLSCLCWLLMTETLGCDVTVYATLGVQSVLACPLSSVINNTQWFGPPGDMPYNLYGTTTLNQKLPADFASRLAIHPTTGALIINNTQKSDENCYTCKVMREVITVKLSIRVSPQPPFIDKTLEDNGLGRMVLWAMEESQVILVCQVKGGNPQPSLKWIRGGVTWSDVAANNSVQNNTNGTYDVMATITVMAYHSEDRVRYFCQANHTTWTSPQNASVELYLYLKPRNPVLLEQGSLQEGGNLSVKCNVTGCRPAANLTWTGLQGQQIQTNTWLPNDETYNVTSLYNTVVSRQENGVKLVCTVTHITLGSSLNASTTLAVWFPPTSVSITNNRNITAGSEILILTCTTGTSNPIADITWRNGTNVPTGELSIKTGLSGAYGGKIQYQNLTIIPSRYMDGSIIACLAQNSQTTGPSISDRVTLNIRYSPIVQVSITPNMIVTEGDSLVTIQCSASSKPISKFTVTKEGLTTVLSEGLGTPYNRHDYIIKWVNRTDAGRYSCTANNSVVGPQNESNAIADLVVQYPPDITLSTSNITTKDTLARLVCMPHGIPNRYIFDSWQHLWPGYNETLRTLQSTSSDELSATLELKSLSYQDSGIYVCQAGNGIKTAEMQNYLKRGSVFVLIEAPPVILKIPKQIGGTIGGFITIQLEYCSNSDAGLVTLQHSNSSKLYQTEAVDEIDINQLHVQNHYVPAKGLRGNFNISIKEGDFGNYTVNVSNSIGFSITTLEIIQQDVPRKPQNFNYSNPQKTQISLSWNPGFHGGFNQTFVIQISLDKIVWSNASLIPGGMVEGTELFSTTITELLPNLIYHFRIYAFNSKGNGAFADEVITVNTLLVITPDSSSTFSIPAVAGGIGAGVMVILLVVVAFFLWRRHHPHSQHSDGQFLCSILATQRNQINAKSVSHDAANGKDYEGLHINNIEASAYLQLNDISLEENRNATSRPPENDSYEKLHPYTNTDI